MFNLTRAGKNIVLLFILSVLPGVLMAFTNGTYYVFYPSYNNNYAYPYAGGITYTQTPTPVNVTLRGSYYVLTYNGSTYSSWPTSYYVASPAVPNTSIGQYFQLIPVGNATTSTSFSGTAITGGTYATFGWKPISTPSSNIKLTFRAVASTDLHVALQYGTNTYIEIPIGGWTNSKSAVRNFINGGQQGGDIYFYAPTGTNNVPAVITPVIPDTKNPVDYTIVIGAGVLSVTAKTASGASSTLIAYTNQSMLLQKFNAYSFRMCAGLASWTVASDTAVGTIVSYIGTINGYSATSTVSQADADKQARYKWFTTLLPSGVTMETESYGTFTWKSLSRSSSSVKLTFRAIAISDIVIGLQYSATNAIEIVIGGYANTRSCVRVVTQASAPPGVVSETQAQSPTKVIADQVNPISYTLIVQNAQLTITGMLPNGTSYTVLQFSSAILNQNFTAYAFRGHPVYSWRGSDFAGDALSFTSTLNGYSATSTISQVDADAQARNAWLNAKMPSGTTINARPYTAFGWKNIANPVAGNIKLTFNAVATTDLSIGLQYGGSNYLEIGLGERANTKSVVRVFSNSVQQGVDVFATSPAAPIPDTVNPVAYTLTIIGGVLKIDATRSTGSTNVLTYSNAAMLNQAFTAYSFSAYDVNYWRLSGVSVGVISFTGTFNGVTATSTMSQADADAQAQAAWATASVSTITNAKKTAMGVVDPVGATIKTQLQALSDARTALLAIAADPIFTLNGGAAPVLPWTS